MAPRSLGRIFALPAAVGAASVVGLVSALVGDGPWDLLSWLALGLAVVLAAWHGLPWRTRPGVASQTDGGATAAASRRVDSGRS